MRLAVISDTHLPRGGRELPPACLEQLRAADVILHAGDLASGAVLDHLESLGPPVHAVLGNVDGPELAARLPATRELEFEQVRIGLIHDAGAAAGRARRLQRRFPGCDAVVFGHSHIPLHETEIVAGTPFQLCNPGSPTDRRRQPHHTMGLARVDADQLFFELLALD